MNPVDLIEAVRATKARARSSQEAIAALSTALSEFVTDPSNRAVDFPRTTEGLYTRMLLNAPEDDFQIVVVSWSPHSESPIHDHSGTTGVVAALYGTTLETKHRVVRLQGHIARLQQRGTVRLRGPVITPILPDEDMQLHGMVNPTDDWAATVHVYLTPINDFSVYHPSPDGSYEVQSRRLWFDLEGAWRLWTNRTAPRAA